MTTPAQAERRKVFYDALRSGDYTQTDQTLRRIAEDGKARHCCLGVAMEIYMASCETPDAVRYFETFGLLDSDDDTGAFRINVLSPGAVKWFGFSAPGENGQNPYLGNKETGQRHSAAEWNDSYGGTFPMIAALFEENFPAVADES